MTHSVESNVSPPPLQLRLLRAKPVAPNADEPPAPDPASVLAEHRRLT
jgi:hypothetical protein